MTEYAKATSWIFSIQCKTGSVFRKNTQLCSCFLWPPRPCHNTSISHEHTASTFRLWPWRKGQKVPPKCWYAPVRPHIAKIQMTGIWIFTAMKTSNLIPSHDNIINIYVLPNEQHASRIWGFQSGGYEGYHLLGYDVVQSSTDVSEVDTQRTVRCYIPEDGTLEHASSLNTLL
jgi:hypothetical protein